MKQIAALVLVALGVGMPTLAGAAPSRVERLSGAAYVVHDDDGNWGGGTMGITHQRGPDYWAKKVLDLSAVPADVWEACAEVRLSAYFCVRDYSWRELSEANGLDEAFEIVVNGRVHRIRHDSGVPVYLEQKNMKDFIRWHDFVLPKEEFVRGENEIVFRMAPPEGKKPDDYLYLGIDNTVAGGKSWVRFSGGADWQQDKLTVPGGAGEYMVRLYLLSARKECRADWRPREDALDDPDGLLLYAGSHGATTRLEWDPRRLDALLPVRVALEADTTEAWRVRWLDEDGQAVDPAVEGQGGSLEAVMEGARPFLPSGIEVDKAVPLTRVTLRANEDFHPRTRPVDMAPLIAEPKGAQQARAASCQVNESGAVLANDSLQCAFALAGGRLRLRSLYNEYAAAEMVRDPEACALFLVEVAGKRYAGSRDFVCGKLAALDDPPGFAAALTCEAAGLEAVLRVWIDDALRMGLEIANRTQADLDFKVAFPHLSGLAISENPAHDYYFFPWGGGIVSDTPGVVRRGYGDHAALYQVMDLFSPARGAGLAVQCTDEDGRYKVLGVRKYVPGVAEESGDAADTPTADEFKWTSNLPQTPGTGFAFEYLRRTRAPGASFAPAGAAVIAHPGDWHTAMEQYAAWCHRVWGFRPTPSALTPLVNMLAAGWGQSPLFRDGAYRTDFVKPRCDCIELMSWWEWAELGPWRTPWDELEAKLGPALYKRYSAYWVKDPVTGKTMYPLNRGDYDGYNERWGGLEALRAAIVKYREMGALVTLYTDPLLADDNTRCGQQWGERWGIVQPDGTYSRNYESWNMCHDVAEYRQYVADTMRRVMEETDADGIRLDEYGHRGAACFSKRHTHTFAEWGCTEWLRCISETTRMVRDAMDEVKPGSVLTTEHPGYDYLMQFIEGCITYDLTVQATPLRPLECNIQRFYFPECKAFELDHRGADPLHRKRFWNAVASFGSYYPENMDVILRENADVFEGADCAPLVPTRARQVYVNRFGAGPKAVYMVYNATGHTFDGEVLRVPCGEGEHLFDLLHGAEADVTPVAGAADVRVFLPRDEVTCIARLPRRLDVTRQGNRGRAEVHAAGPDARIVVCRADGTALSSAPAGAGAVELSLDGGDSHATVVKLLEGGRLVDAAGIPAAPGDR
ncbi:MAG: hypothetical protein JXR94_01435 [Candidatus Hydrogenedentes bacterium]|nr:hypothetical protein [Candidatus Hydrogenedentota bacterium]